MKIILILTLLFATTTSKASLKTTSDQMLHLSQLELNKLTQNRLTLLQTDLSYSYSLISAKYPPEGRRGHSAILRDNSIFYFGGCYLDDSCHGDLIEYNIETSTFKTVSTSGTSPSPRQGHSATLYGDKMFIFGGVNRAGRLNDLFSFDFPTLSWTKEDYAGVIPPISNHSALLTSKKKIMIFGGYSVDY